MDLGFKWLEKRPAPQKDLAEMPEERPASVAQIMSLRTLQWMLVAGLFSLVGCASSGTGGAVDKTLEVLGFRSPVSADEVRTALPPSSRKVALRLHAADLLNTDSQKRPLSVVIRIYKLRGADAFLSAPYAAFIDGESNRQPFRGDIVESRELVLRPGQRHEVIETLPNEATHLGVVALFRSPAESRWRFAFRSREAERSGVTLGVHGCALSVAAGVPEAAEPDTLRIAAVQCE